MKPLAHNGHVKALTMLRPALLGLSFLLLSLSFVLSRPSTAEAAIQCASGCFADEAACAAATSGCGAGTSCAACVTGCTSIAACPSSGGATTTSTPTPDPRRTSLVNPLGTRDIKTLVGRAIRGFMFLSGSFALLMFVYGSFMWVTSAGNMEKVKKGKNVFVWATIGLVVIFGSYAFLNTFLNALGGT